MPHISFATIFCFSILSITRYDLIRSCHLIMMLSKALCQMTKYKCYTKKDPFHNHFFHEYDCRYKITHFFYLPPFYCVNLSV